MLVGGDSVGELREVLFVWTGKISWVGVFFERGKDKDFREGKGAVGSRI